MRSFTAILALAASLSAGAVAQDTQSYDATVYVTSTIYKVNTVTLSSSPAYEVANSTTTVPASMPSAPVVSAAGYSVPANSTAPFPTGSSAPSAAPPAPSVTEFPGAASAMGVSGAVAGLVAVVVGALAL